MLSVDREAIGGRRFECRFAECDSPKGVPLYFSSNEGLEHHKKMVHEKEGKKLFDCKFSFGLHSSVIDF